MTVVTCHAPPLLRRRGAELVTASATMNTPFVGTLGLALVMAMIYIDRCPATQVHKDGYRSEVTRGKSAGQLPGIVNFGGAWKTGTRR